LEAYSQSEPNREDDLLDEFSLQIVLAMLAVMVSAEELSQLESLTDAQKRQVWTATPEEVKARLKQLRADAQSKEKFRELQAEAIEAIESVEVAEAIEAIEAAEEEWEESEVEAIGEVETVEDTEALLEEMDEEIARLPLFQSYEAAPALHEGDWVVLKAMPQLTAVELVATWEVMAIQGEHARIESKKLGQRLYPMAWMVVYPELEF
jgi:hypothetical protein